MGKMTLSALARAFNTGALGKTGPGQNAAQSAASGGALPFGAGPAAFKSAPPPPFQGARGPNPNTGLPWGLKFIPPLALFNDASQWANRKWFVRPMPFNQNPDSNPPLRAQYFTPPPIAANDLAAGALNLQLQLGNISIQAQQLTQDAANYFG